MNPVSFLELAYQLATQSEAISESETDPVEIDRKSALVRSSVSRSYYSVFLYARQVADLFDFEEPEDVGASVHVALWKFFGLMDRALASRCKGLKRYRHKADYDITSGFNVSPLDQVDAAWEILGVLDQMAKKKQGIVDPSQEETPDQTV